VIFHVLNTIFRLYFYIVVALVLNIVPAGNSIVSKIYTTRDLIIALFWNYLRSRLKFRTRMKNLITLFWNYLRSRLKFRTRMKNSFVSNLKFISLQRETIPSELKEIKCVDAKVALLCIGSLAAGGAERQWVNLAIGIKEKGYEPIIVIEQNTQNASEWLLRDLHDNAIDIISLSDVRDRFAVLKLNRLKLEKENFKYDHQLFLNIQNISKVPIFDFYLHVFHKFKNSVIFAALDGSILFSYYANRSTHSSPFISSFRSLSPSYYKETELMFGQDFQVFRQLYKSIVEDSNVKFVANSEHGKESYSKYLKFVSEGRSANIRVIPNEIYLSETALRIANINQIKCCKDFHVLGIMRLSSEKDPLGWLRVARSLFQNLDIQMHFILIGAGTLKDDVDKELSILRELGMNIELKTSNFILKYLNLKGLCIVTSLSEGHSNLVDELKAFSYPTYIVNPLNLEYIPLEKPNIQEITEVVLEIYESPQRDSKNFLEINTSKVMVSSYLNLLKK